MRANDIAKRRRQYEEGKLAALTAIQNTGGGIDAADRQAEIAATDPNPNAFTTGWITACIGYIEEIVESN